MDIDQETLISAILDRLENDSINILEQWNSAKKGQTKYFVVDNLLAPIYCSNIFNAFPKDSSGFFTRNSFREKKKTTANLSNLDFLLKNFIYSFHDERIISKISKLVGLQGIEPDSTLYAAGLSMMHYGDFLNPHIDNSHDAKIARYRRLNLLYYVSPDWKLENGGNLELWAQNEKTPITILAKTNRLVVMETNRTSWHSVSKIRVNQPRCCVSNYYFSKNSPDTSEYFHVTSFTGRPDEKLKKAIGFIDNFARNAIAKIFKAGRGKKLLANDDDKDFK